ncbi:hypothetical protein ACRE_017420 [Hapsidospora chrysogenum ATCC 11550]|uniref:F-box domain-containing protein n=1 Tax=Hapsidospora chrysogenum (strain ATCC 11550 / CBS 779.69 / DSM 880 / IAM 14645 / JCM 23072 / IMI 49137) TaxID=857340 RepID=A0A086TD81_HAPC1|nr:hypothetical protein ACRE_017420 [Hapsidospora chrysogenum ATCC 11550]
MASLLSLPPEIQTHIISLLNRPSEPSIKSIKSIEPLFSILPVLKTRKQLYDVAIPLSVRTYYCPLLSPSEAEESHSRSRILQFLRYVTIIKLKPANCIRAIVLEPVIEFSHGSEAPGPDLARQERDLYRNFIESVVTSVHHHERARERWLADLDAGLDDAERALLLVACPNVEVFSFTHPGTYGTDHLLLLLNIARRARRRHGGRQHQHWPSIRTWSIRTITW